jgi:hypothetical protein
MKIKDDALAFAWATLLFKNKLDMLCWQSLRVACARLTLVDHTAPKGRDIEVMP